MTSCSVCGNEMKFFHRIFTGYDKNDSEIYTWECLVCSHYDEVSKVTKKSELK